jgi:hypothetical protein
MPLQATSGTASYDGFGGGAAAVPNYIEDVFSTYVYVGDGTNGRAITNNIDLSTKGGLVWVKSRTNLADHDLCDTVRGATKKLKSNGTDAQNSMSDVTAFSTTGFTIGDVSGNGNSTGANIASWTFRKQPKFFDVVTYTGDGAFTQLINHSLGSVPGAMFIKRTDSTSDWFVYHRNTGNDKRTRLNSDAIAATSPFLQYETPTSTQFTVGWESGVANVNESGATYVAYLFAHNAGGFGLTGTDNVITCGTFTTNSSGVATVNLGWEPQWVLIKNTQTTTGANWQIVDNMRGWSADTSTSARYLAPNAAFAEDSTTSTVNATGFTYTWAPSATHIYIAIRRGPMKVPTSGASVFEPVTYSGDSSAPKTIGSSTIVSDIVLWANRFATAGNGTARPLIGPRLVGGNVMQTSSSTRYEADYLGYLAWRNQFGVDLEQTSADSNVTGESYILYLMRRAPSCIDVVCYTGTGSNTTQAHNLGVVPELIIFKRRNAASAWNVYSSALLNTEYLIANTTAAKATGATRWNSTTPTASVFSLGTESAVNASGGTYVAYLFATAAGVSKVGSYTGTATTLQIDCGFTGGARFVLIKRTDSTGDWFVWDTARGIVSGNDPYLLLNGITAEATSTDYIDTYSAGFEISSTAPASINASGGSFIFLAIA